MGIGNRDVSQVDRAGAAKVRADVPRHQRGPRPCVHARRPRRDIRVREGEIERHTPTGRVEAKDLHEHKWGAAEGSHHEEALIAAFISQRWRSRARQQLGGRRRARWISDSEKAIDPRYVVPIAPSLQKADAIAGLLTSRSGEMLCWTMSENPNWDAKSEILGRALHRIVVGRFVSFISCEPGKLAYFDGEGPSVRFILRRTDGP